MGNPKKNYIEGKSFEIPIPDCSLAEYFIPLVKSHPKGTVIQVDAVTGYEETSEEVLKKSLQVSEGYSKMGLSQNDTFCLIAKNSSHVYSAVLGVVWLGGVVAPLDSDCTIYELENMFKKIKPTAIICEEGVTEKVAAVLKNLGCQAKVIVLTTKQLVKEDYISFEEILETHVVVEDYIPKPVESPSTKTAVILPTSGTTGMFKGVELTHRNLLYNITSQRHKNIWGTCKNFLVLSHFYWITCFFSLMASLCFGTKKIYMTDISMKNVLNAIKKYKPQATIASPMVVSQIVNYPDANNFGLTSLQIVMLAGTPVTQALVDDVKKIWKDQSPLINLYGATEVSGAVTFSRRQDDVTWCGKPSFGVKIKVNKVNWVWATHVCYYCGLEFERNYQPTSGLRRIIFGTTVGDINELEIDVLPNTGKADWQGFLIVDPDTGKVLGANEEGEVYAQCPGIMKGYIGDEEETKAVIVDGWCRTGDLGYYDEEEKLKIVGRLKEMIKDLGRQIAPSEIENVIMLIPGVEEAAVAGVEHESGKADLIGFVVKRAGSDITEKSIKDEVNEKLSDYKQLKEVVFLDKLPRTTTAKLKRKILNEMAKSLTSQSS